jgi:hypothetical protein
MAVHKIRRKLVAADGATFTGSVGFNGPMAVNATMTLSSALIHNVPPRAAMGGANRVAGITRINSGATSATQSTTALNSGAVVLVSPVLLGAGVASYNLIGQVVVTTVAPQGSGGYFSLGYLGTQSGVAANIDVGWFIVNP